MKVLQLNSVCGFGSTGRIVTDLYDITERMSNSCLITYGRGNANCDLNTYRIGNKFDLLVHGIKTRIFDRHGFGSFRATKNLIEIIKKYNPDIIHLHNIHGYYVNIHLLFSYFAEANKPVIWTLHDCWALTGHCSHFEFVGCDRWQKGCFRCPQKKEYPASWFIDNCKLNYENKCKSFNSVKNMTIVTPSKWLLEIVNKSYLNKYNSRVLSNGIDLGVFSNLKSQLKSTYKSENKFIILGVASIWNERKGLKIFIDLSDKLNENYQIILVGLNKKQIKKLPKNIIAIERTNNTLDLVELYSVADVYVNPTFEDTFPTTNLEALSCGTPVISFPSGGSAEVITEKCGIVTSGKTIEALCNAIEILKTKEIKPIDCREQATHYNKNLKYLEYVKLYEEIIIGIAKEGV